VEIRHAGTQRAGGKDMQNRVRAARYVVLAIGSLSLACSSAASDESHEQNGNGDIDVDFKGGSFGGAGGGSGAGGATGGTGGSGNLPPLIRIISPYDAQVFTTFIGGYRAVIPLNAEIFDPEGRPMSFTWAYRAFRTDGTLTNGIIHSSTGSTAFNWTVPNEVMDLTACQRPEGQIFHVILSVLDKGGPGAAEAVSITIGCAPP
jgi:hypothetical protein